MDRKTDPRGLARVLTPASVPGIPAGVTSVGTGSYSSYAVGALPPLALFQSPLHNPCTTHAPHMLRHSTPAPAQHARARAHTLARSLARSPARPEHSALGALYGFGGGQLRARSTNQPSI